MRDDESSLKSTIQSILIVIAVPTALVVLGCVMLFQLLRAILYGGPCSPDFQAHLKFKLPPSARNDNCSDIGMQGWVGAATFEMSPHDLETFKASTPVQHWSTNDLTPNENWTPPSKYLHGEYHETYYDQDVLIDMSNPALYKVKISVQGD